MRVISCLCHATNLIKADKFALKDIISMMIRSANNQKGYKLYDLEYKMLFVSRDVVSLKMYFSSSNTDQADWMALLENMSYEGCLSSQLTLMIHMKIQPT